MTQFQEHELDELELETSQEQLEYARLTEAKDRGLISYAYYQKFLYETGRLENKPIALPAAVSPSGAVRMQPFRGCAQAKRPKDNETPKPKRVRRPPCTPQPGEKEKRIKAALSACPKHPNGHERERADLQLKLNLI